MFEVEEEGDDEHTDNCLMALLQNGTKLTVYVNPTGAAIMMGTGR